MKQSRRSAGRKPAWIGGFEDVAPKTELPARRFRSGGADADLSGLTLQAVQEIHGLAILVWASGQAPMHVPTQRLSGSLRLCSAVDSTTEVVPRTI